MKLRSILVSVTLVGAILAIAGGLGYWKYKQIQIGMAEGAKRPEQMEMVQFLTAEVGPFQRTVTAVGTVQALRHVTISSEVSGKILEVGFESGDIVDEGRVLVRLDSSTEEADRRLAEAQGNLAKVSLDRMEKAAEGKAVSDQDLDKSRAEYQQSLARLQQIDTMIAKKTIKATFRGRMGLRDIHPGQYLAEGQRVTMLQGVDDSVYVDFSVPQIQATVLPVGSKVFVSLLGNDIPATITAVDAQIDLATRNARLRATMPSFGGRLVTGMFVDVKIPLGEPVDVVRVSPTAIRRAPFGDHVFVVEPDPKDPAKLRAHQRFIKVAGGVDGKVIIADGIKPGERLAGDGSFKLREGVLVMEAPDKPVAAAAKPDPAQPH